VPISCARSAGGGASDEAEAAEEEHGGAGLGDDVEDEVVAAVGELSVPG
jgi:hypothetical protein